MPTYQYDARDHSGAEANGVLVADSERILREQLRAKDLYLTRVRVLGGQQFRTSRSLFARKVKLYDLVIMSRQLATLVRSGVTVVEALDALQLQTQNPLLAETLNVIRSDILSGDSMSLAMSRHPAVFSEMYCALVAAGEEGGTLEDTLELAAEQLDNQQALREQVKSALVYPIIVVIAAVLVIAVILTVVVPVFKKVYDKFDHELPGITNFLLWLSDLVMTRWFVVLPILVGGALALRAYLATNEGREIYDSIKLRVWLFGPLFRKIGVAEFTQTFTGMVKGGVPIIGAMQVAANTSSNVVIRKAIIKSSESISQGSPLSTSLVESGQFPPMVTRMVASGEKSGNLDAMLDELTKFYKRDIEHTVQRLTKIMEPVMTVIVGAIVLFTLLALYMPIFMLSQVIRR